MLEKTLKFVSIKNIVMLNVKGKLKVKGDEVQVSDKFRKREFVVTIDASSAYPQHVQFQLVQDKCGLIEGFGIGEEISVSFNLRGREWTKDNQVKYFNSLDAWKIERLGNSGHAENSGAGKDITINKNVGSNETSGSSPVMTDFGSGSDDLPF